MDKEQLLEADEQHVPATPSPGQLLREAREKQGLSQQAIADKLFLRVNIISDLEENRLDENTSVTFFKGYVRLYAKNVGLNPEELIALFEQYHTAPKPPAKLQSFSKRVAKQAHDDRWMMVTYIIALILLAGVVVWWYQQPANDDDFVPSSSTTSTTSSSTAASQSVASVGSTNIDDSAYVENSAEQADASLNDDEAVADDTYQDEALTTPEVSDTNTTPLEEQDSSETADSGLESRLSLPATNQETSQDEAGKVALTFTFAGECWVNVTDSTGEALAFGIKAEGYVMSVSGVPPFEVTLGAPHVVQIDYDGDAVDMSGFDPKRTAKFYLPMQEQ